MILPRVGKERRCRRVVSCLREIGSAAREGGKSTVIVQHVDLGCEEHKCFSSTN